MGEKQFGSIKRFGARYGRTVKHNLAKIEEGLRNFQKCPYCFAVKVKRVSSGVWHCRKCDAKFTGKAYIVSGKLKPIVLAKPIEEVDEEMSLGKKKEKVSEEE
ncbi:MAG: hypothetical protein V1837_04175 [Candidatus Woesearchaeota archaeon]